MTDRLRASILERTYLDSVTAFRPLSAGAEALVCENVPCGLSRSAHTSAPQPPDGDYVLPEALYRLTLFTRPETVFALGDRVEITDTAGRVFHGRASDSFRYPCHCATVVEVREILPPTDQTP